MCLFDDEEDDVDGFVLSMELFEPPDETPDDEDEEEEAPLALVFVGFVLFVLLLLFVVELRLDKEGVDEDDAPLVRELVELDEAVAVDDRPLLADDEDDADEDE